MLVTWPPSGGEPAGDIKTGDPGSRATSPDTPTTWPPRAIGITHLQACKTCEMREVGYGPE